MGLPSQSVVSSVTHQSFSKLISDLPEDQQPTLERLAEKIRTEIHAPGFDCDFAGTMKVIQKVFLAETAALTSADRRGLRRALVAKFALELPGIMAGLGLPENVHDQYPGTIDRLAAYLAENNDDSYGFADDVFVKDICFTLGRSLPCGAQIVELGSYVRLRSIVRHTLVCREPNTAWQYLRASSPGEWFRIHTEVRYLTDFNEPGWDACYLRVAALLAQRKSVRGMVGTSWFYDPQLVEISPRLAYLQLRLLERGAFQIRHRTTPLDIERATMKSKTRRRLYEEGKYSPASYSLVWPRKQLLKWASSQRSDGHAGG